MIKLIFIICTIASMKYTYTDTLKSGLMENQQLMDDLSAGFRKSNFAYIKKNGSIVENRFFKNNPVYRIKGGRVPETSIDLETNYAILMNDSNYLLIGWMFNTGELEQFNAIVKMQKIQLIDSTDFQHYINAIFKLTNNVIIDDGDQFERIMRETGSSPLRFAHYVNDTCKKDSFFTLINNTRQTKLTKNENGYTGKVLFFDGYFENRRFFSSGMKIIPFSFYILVYHVTTDGTLSILRKEYVCNYNSFRHDR